MRWLGRFSLAIWFFAFFSAVLPAPVAFGKGKRLVDEMHPRAPDSPLKIDFEDFYCQTCLEEGRIEVAGTQKITLMRMDALDLAVKLGVGKKRDLGKKFFIIHAGHTKIFSNLVRGKVKPNDSAFITFDMQRMKKIFPKLKLGLQGTVLTPHQRAHLYHIRLCRVYSHFKALTNCKKDFLGMEAPYEVYLFDDYSEHHLLNDRYTGRTNDKAGIRHHNRDKPNFMIFTTADSQVAGNDAKFSNHVIHNYAHNLVDGFWNFYRETPAWIEEGLAHYYERRESPKHNTFCWAEGKSPTAFQKPDWSSTLLGMVRRGKDMPLGGWCEKLRPGELSGAEQGLSWGIVEWMIETDPIRFTKLLELTQDRKGKPTAADAITKSFGASPNVIHTRWREFAKREYPRRKN